MIYDARFGWNGADLDNGGNTTRTVGNFTQGNVLALL